MEAILLALINLSYSDEDRQVWEERSGKKKPKWLRETLKDALKAGTPSDKVRAIKIGHGVGGLYTRF